MKISPALALLTLVWEKGSKQSWQTINLSMRNALRLAICSGMAFVASDFRHCKDEFRWGYWVTSNPEWIYLDAVVNNNMSCVKAWEAFCGRIPFIANGVQSSSRESYLHTGSITRTRERLAVGLSFPIGKATWYVTGFDDDVGTLRAARYANRHAQGKPKQLKRFTHQEIKDLFPAPKKAHSNEPLKEVI